MEDSTMKRLIVLGGIVLVVVGGIWLVKRSKSKEENVFPEIVLESSKQMDGSANLQMPMSEAEKQEIEDKFLSEGVEMTVLKDVSGGQAVGTTWRLFDGQKFYHKVEASGLASLDKGYFYEGWLVSKEGFFSTGRLGEMDGSGKLHYTAEGDKTSFTGVVITKEPEDGDKTPAEHVLEGSF